MAAMFAASPGVTGFGSFISSKVVPEREEEGKTEARGLESLPKFQAQVPC